MKLYFRYHSVNIYISGLVLRIWTLTMHRIFASVSNVPLYPSHMHDMSTLSWPCLEIAMATSSLKRKSLKHKYNTCFLASILDGGAKVSLSIIHLYDGRNHFKYIYLGRMIKWCVYAFGYMWYLPNKVWPHHHYDVLVCIWLCIMFMLSTYVYDVITSKSAS